MTSFLRLPGGRYVNVAAIVAITPGRWSGQSSHPDGCTIRTSDGASLAVAEWSAEETIAHLSAFESNGDRAPR